METENWAIDWAQKWQLSAATLEALSSEGFESPLAIQQLTPALIDEQFKGISLAQRLLLKTAANDLKQPTGDGPMCQSVAPEDDPGQLTRLLQQAALSSTAAPDQRQAPQPGAAATPTATLCDLLRASSAAHAPLAAPGMSHTKLREVRDYVTLAPEKPQTFSVGDMHVQFRLKDSRISHDKLSVAQYFEGAIKIAIEMIEKDYASVSEIQQYLGFVSKIATFTQVFDWVSVLNYDKEARREQHEQNKGWNHDNSFLMQALLRQKAVQHAAHDKRLGGTDRNTDPRTGKPICLRFNSTQGCTLRMCRFSHVCKVCLATSHSEQGHRAATLDQPKN
jgi:hypothetical protein